MELIMVEEEVKFDHCEIGEVIQLPNDSSFYLVCRSDAVDDYRQEPPGGTGLYKEHRAVFLVNLQTGLFKKRPHLSAKVIRRPDMVLTKEPSND